MSAPKSSFHGLLARGMPAVPNFLNIIAYVVIGLSVACLVASAVALSAFGGYGVGGAPGFIIFDAIWTWIVVGGSMAVAKFAPTYYFRIVVLVLWIKALIFWLSAWAWSASAAAIWLGYTSSYYYYGDYTKFGAGMAASAGLGAILWVLMIVYLVFWIKACLADPEGIVVHPTTNAELGQVKQEPTATVTPVQEPYGQPQGQYAPQYPQQYPQQPAAEHHQPYSH